MRCQRISVQQKSGRNDFEDDPTVNTYSLYVLRLLVLTGNIKVYNISTSNDAKAWESPHRLDPGGLSDLGANMCMTNQKDLILNLQPLQKPIGCGVAVTSKRDRVEKAVCTHISKFILPLTSGEYYSQP